MRYEVFQPAPPAVPRAVNGGLASALPPCALPYRRDQSICTDLQFSALREAYRASGGLASAEQLLASSAYPVAVLARWIVAGQVLSFGWQASTWFPRFQFDRRSMTPRHELALVFAELNSVYDDCELAHWFVQPNPLLAERTPVDMLGIDFPAVLAAARADRFIVDG